MTKTTSALEPEFLELLLHGSLPGIFAGEGAPTRARVFNKEESHIQ